VSEQRDATLTLSGLRRAMAESARVAHLARRSLDYGVRTGSVSVDVQRVRRRAHSLVPHAVAARPDGVILDEASVLELDAAPEHLLIVGGGAAGAELAQLYRRFGSRVSLVTRSAQLLPGEDRDVAAALAEVLRQDGVAVFLESSAAAPQVLPDGRVALNMRFPSGEHRLFGSHVAVLGEGIGHADYGPPRTNPGWRGHTSAIEAGRCRMVFTDPPLARLGITEGDARAQGLAMKVAKVSSTRSFVKLLADAGTHHVLGAAVLATDAAEAVAMLQAALIGRIPCPLLRGGLDGHTIPAHSLAAVFAALEEAELEEHADVRNARG
jgi:hypothetical protein